MLTIVLGSVVAMGTAFLGTKIYPIQKGGDISTATSAIEETLDSVKESIQPEPEPLQTETTTPLETEVTPPPENIEQTLPEAF